MNIGIYLFNVYPLLQYDPWQPNRYQQTHWYESILFYIAVIVITVIIITVTRWQKPHYHSHWNILIDDFQHSTHDFYERLKVELETKKIKGLYTKEVNLKEGNIVSSRRTYLRLVWRNYQYDICASPFSTGFFVSWWLIDHIPYSMELFIRIPYIGKRLVNVFFPVTYYKIDTASMFMTYVHSCVQKVIKEITQEKGVKGISELQQKPILNDIFKR